MSDQSKPENDDAFTCIACGETIKPGDLVYIEINTGYIHAACASKDRDSFINEDGSPLAEGEPMPEPFAFEADQ